MRSLLACLDALPLCTATLAQMPKVDDLLKGAGTLGKMPATSAVEDKTGAAGIKEALAVGTKCAVMNLLKSGGHFANQKDLMGKAGDMGSLVTVDSRWHDRRPERENAPCPSAS